MYGSDTPVRRHDSAEAIPRELRLASTRDRLAIIWNDGRQDALDAATLRRNCQSAGAKRLRIDNLDGSPASGLAITDVRLVGSYAINIAFSDGHARGIYPWSLLRSLGAAVDPSDKAIS
jgi:prepilin-type processing-associated H-X9-DG protein